MTKHRTFHYSFYEEPLVQYNKAKYPFFKLFMLIWHTVPNLLVIFVFESNFLDVPKSMTFSVALLDFESKIKFSGFRSLFFIIINF